MGKQERRLPYLRSEGIIPKKSVDMAKAHPESVQTKPHISLLPTACLLFCLDHCKSTGPVSCMCAFPNVNIALYKVNSRFCCDNQHDLPCHRPLYSG